MTSTTIPVPLLNANEPEARLVAIHVENGSLVKKGELLFTIETTKAAADVEAPEAGYLHMLARIDDTLAVGDTLAVLTSTLDEVFSQPEQRPVPTSQAAANSPQADPAAEARLTQPARALAEQLGLDLARLPKNRLVTEAVVRQFAASARQTTARPINAQLLIYGAGGHAKAVMEMARAIGAFGIAGIIDDNADLTGSHVLGIPVLGTREILPQLVEQGIRMAANGVGGIINIGIRIRLFELLASQGFAFPILCHPRATVEASAQISDGVQVFANAYVGSSVVLHEKCMINTGAIVSHDCEIGSYTHIAPGAMLAGMVSVGERALVGMGVTTAIGIQIGSGARIGNGAVLLADVPERAIIPAGKVWSA